MSNIRSSAFNALLLCAAVALISFSAFAQPGAGLSLIDDAVGKALADGKMPGAVIIVGRGDSILYRKAFGNRALVPVREPMTVDTIFDVASLTKPLATTVSVISLIEQGRLSPEDRVGMFFPEIKDEDARRITVRQLLTHVSGYAPDFDLGRRWSGTEAMLEELASEPLRHRPGTRFVYSDIGFIVLGEIVRRVSGQPLDVYSKSIFRGLGMNSTMFLPLQNGADPSMIAPTEFFSGQQSYLGSSFEGSKEEARRMLRGEVHDPTAFRMGGVAGHAGLFSTADDLSLFCRMMLAGGELEGKRVLSAYAVSLMTAPVVVSEEGWTRGFGWDIDTRFSSNRGALFPKGSFGHTGFTGTGIWMDPVSGVYVIFLSNRVHPDGKGDISEVRAAVSTIAASALAHFGREALNGFEAAYAAKVAAGISAFRSASSSDPAATARRKPVNGIVLSGIDVLEKNGFKELDGLTVGLVTNHTGRNIDGKPTIDILFKAQNVRLDALFSPEHGIRGDLDQSRIADSKDEVTGLPIYSLYGSTRRPSPEQLKPLDAIVFDIQDIGTRFYTYISTLRYVMEEAAKAGKPVFVLDRPNPVNGVDIEGPLADEAALSFTAPHEIPVRHGMTAGELALMMNSERKIGADVRVIVMEGWNRRMWFDETGREWINPSPNMRSLTQATLYPGIGLLETTNLSVGRGTDTPFEVVGAPWMDGRKLAAYLNARRLPGVRFVPVTFTPTASVFKGERCSGVNIIVTDRESFKPLNTGGLFAIALRELHPGEWEFKRYSGLLANEASFRLFESGEGLSQLGDLWSVERGKFITRRSNFLLYK